MIFFNMHERNAQAGYHHTVDYGKTYIYQFTHKVHTFYGMLT